MAFASHPTVLILLGTLRLCVVGKNYRLQDIQLSESELTAGALARAGTSHSTHQPRPMQARRVENLSCSPAIATSP